MKRHLHLGKFCPIPPAGAAAPLYTPAHHLLTHGVLLGMTGSGKTGLLTVMVEEALGQGVPVLMIDVKGDLPNLALAFPSFDPGALEPWVEPGPADPRSPEALAAALAQQREQSLKLWGIAQPRLEQFHQGHSVRVITPGSSAGESLHVLSALEHPSSSWEADPEDARASLSAAVSLLLRLIGRDPDPAKSRDHVLISVLAERRLRAGEPSNLGALLRDVLDPPVTTIGALPVDSFVSPRSRADLAASLNTLLASPTFATWREGAPLDIGAWLQPGPDGKTPAVIVSVAHLDDEERALVLGVVLEEFLTWMRGLKGTQHLRALLVFDEMYGFLPPHPSRPPTKAPLVALMKQARAFGVGVLLATQNPMDLDYRALSNAGLWCVGRLQTDADRARVVEGLSHGVGTGSLSAAQLSKLVKLLSGRWFIMRDVHSPHGTVLFQPRWAMSYLRGPMTPQEIRRVNQAAALQPQWQTQGSAPAAQ